MAQVEAASFLVGVVVGYTDLLVADTVKTLLIGAGNSKTKRIVHPSTPDRAFDELVTLDLRDADVIHDLDVFDYPFEDNEFDEIHGYEVLEHCGRQGDESFFFAQFNEFHRILKPKGLFCGSVPLYTSIWAFGDPGHKRVLPPCVFEFLSEDFYSQVGKTACADYRHLIEGYWQHVEGIEKGESFFFIQRAV
jgi:SAM-dependent methyltransferase